MVQKKPLTQEQLREMNGKAVRVESETEYIPSGIYLCDVRDGEVPRLWGYECDNWFLYEFIKGIKVYAYSEPPRLDREEWEPCEDCEDYSVKCCANCRYRENLQYQDPCNSCYCVDKWEPKENFCPECGRPLTDEAWQMLEKRIEN